MGRLIDADELLKYGACPNDCKGTATCTSDHEHMHCPIRVFDIESINDCPTVEAIPKADYENRLKSDMVAMLEDLDLQIDELAAYNREYAKIQRLIRDKINALRGTE